MKVAVSIIALLFTVAVRRMRHVKLGERQYKTLDEIFSDKENSEGLLDSVKPVKKSSPAASVLEQKFQSINRFYKKHSRKPCSDSADPSEVVLAATLHSIRNNPDLASKLSHLDTNHLLD